MTEKSIPYGNSYHKKLFVFQIKTSGPDPDINSIIGLSGALINYDYHVQLESFKFNIRHTEEDSLVSKKALRAQGIRFANLKKYSSPEKVKAKLDSFFSEYIKDDFTDEMKFIPVAYDMMFNYSFLDRFYRRLGGAQLSDFLRARGHIDLQTLETFCRLKRFIPEDDSAFQKFQLDEKFEGIPRAAFKALQYYGNHLWWNLDDYYSCILRDNESMFNSLTAAN